MEDLNNHAQKNTKLEIHFPKSNEDHRLQLVSVNGSIFAILFGSLESLGPFRLECEEWSLVILSPIKSQTNVLVFGINVICLSEIISVEGSVNVHAKNRLVKFGDMFKAKETVSEMGEKSESQFDDDAGGLLYYYKQFESIIESTRNPTPESIADAQQKMIASLYTLADKVKGKPGDLNVEDALKVWNIPGLG